MKYKLIADFPVSSSAVPIMNDIENFITNFNDSIFIKDSIKGKGRLSYKLIKDNVLELCIKSEGFYRAHNILPRFKKAWTDEIGKRHCIGGRKLIIKEYFVKFELKKEPLKSITIPFAKLKINANKVIMILNDIDEEFLRHNYIDRMINRVIEKVENQYYQGKKEFWKLIWQSGEKKPVWKNDPTEEMVKIDWLKQGPTKGKWFYRPQATAILKTMERIAIEEVLTPLGFQEVIASHIVPFDIWLKTGHLEGMPFELYYVCEPISRDSGQWERFIDLTKIIKEIPVDELKKNIGAPKSGICYAQCPMIYWSLKGKTISEKSMPILIYDKTTISNRYESGGRHGMERVDEFHRIEPVYIGTLRQLLELREKMINRYKYVFNRILDLEWRMAWVTPWFMQQAGKIVDSTDQDTGTIDFEAYMPYRGDRQKSKWLEFQNISILGDKYIKAFNIKSQKSEIYSGCSGIGLERWTTAFLAQKGLNSINWPQNFIKYLGTLPRGIEFL
jgi:seryl-tRNA synthetase